MITMAQRIEALRVEKGLSRPQLSAALGLPKSAMEKFETGRQTPTQDQQKKLADYFGVSLFYLRGESDDRTRPRRRGWPHAFCIFEKQILPGNGARHRAGGAAFPGRPGAGAQSRAQGAGAALTCSKEREGLETFLFFCLLL